MSMELPEKSKKVLMLLYNFPPCSAVGAFRAIRFIKKLHLFNWFPIVLAPSNGIYSHYDYQLEEAISDRCKVYRAYWLFPFSFLRGINNNFRPSRLLQAFLSLWENMLIPDGKITWFPCALSKASRIAKKENIDIIYASGGPFSTLILGAALKSIIGKKLILDYRDPWSLSLETMMNKNQLYRPINQMIEAHVLKTADKIILNTETLKEAYMRFFPDIPKSKFATITNSYDEEMKRNYDQMPDIFRDESACNILYAGNFYGNRNPRNFFLALERLFDRNQSLRNQIRFIYAGSNDMKTYSKQIRELGLEKNIESHQRVNVIEVLELYKKADLLLLMNPYGTGSEVVCPQKFFDYLMVKKPIICLTKPGALYDLMQKTKSGLTADPDNVREITEAIECCYNKFYVKKKRFMPQKLSDYSSHKKTSQLVRVFESTLLQSTIMPDLYLERPD